MLLSVFHKFALFSVTIVVSTHLCLFCCPFYYLMSLFQGHVASSKFSSTGPQLNQLVKLMNGIMLSGMHLIA